MSIEQLIEQLQTHLKAMYQRAIDADTKLDHLKKKIKPNLKPFLNQTLVLKQIQVDLCHI